MSYNILYLVHGQGIPGNNLLAFLTKPKASDEGAPAQPGGQ